MWTRVTHAPATLFNFLPPLPDPSMEVVGRIVAAAVAVLSLIGLVTTGEPIFALISIIALAFAIDMPNLAPNIFYIPTSGHYVPVPTYVAPPPVQTIFVNQPPQTYYQQQSYYPPYTPSTSYHSGYYNSSPSVPSSYPPIQAENLTRRATLGHRGQRMDGR